MLEIALKNILPLENRHINAILHGAAASAAIILALTIIFITAEKKQIEKRQSQLAHETISINQANLKKKQEKPLKEKMASNKPEKKIASPTITLSTALPQAPIKSITEQDRGLILPIVSLKGLTPYNAYKKPFLPPKKDEAIVALAFSGYGLSEQLSEKTVANIPNNITLMASPYTKDLQKRINLARKHGFEIWMNLPVQNKSYPKNDTGNKTILLHSSLQLNVDRALWLMGQAAGYAGIYSEFDETFQHSKNMIKDLFEYIFSRGVGYLELSSTGSSSVEGVAILQDAPYLQSDLNIKSLDELHKIEKFIPKAKEKKTSVITLQLSPALLKKAPEIIDILKENGIKTAPLSAIYDNKWSKLKK